MEETEKKAVWEEVTNYRCTNCKALFDRPFGECPCCHFSMERQSLSLAGSRNINKLLDI